MRELVRVELFGSLRLVRGAHVIDRFRTQKTAALLAYLALHAGRRIPREVLADLLWPEASPESGRHSVRLALNALRGLFKTLEADEALGADRMSVWLEAERTTTDIGAFEAALHAARRCENDPDQERFLNAALALYPQPLLVGVYEPWVAPHRIRLEERFAESAHARIALLEKRGDLAAARAAAAGAVAVHPERDDLREARDRLREDLAARTLPREKLSSAGAARNPLRPGVHLPLPLTRFFGRRTELADLERLVEDGRRLITLTGPGGAGKTRLAIEAAHRLASRYLDSIAFVSLAEIADPLYVADAVRRALGLGAPPPGASAADQVEAALLRAPATLLVLDNAEHLLDGGALAGWLQRLFSVARQLTVLVTSRRPLGIPGEQEFPVPPLPIPASDLWDDIAAIPSVALFVDRARQVRPDFAQTASHARAVAELCRRLEGLPLALEIAAARAAVMSPAQMLVEIASRLDFLTRRRAEGQDRHRSLRAAILWSYGLLSPELRSLFVRLSVFRGGWTLSAAAAVTGEAQLLDAMDDLRAHSLVLRAGCEEDEPRFAFLETLRAFADEQLRDDERQTLHMRHARHFAEFAARIGPWRARSGPPENARRLLSDHENVRAALAWAAEPAAGRDRLPLGLDLAGEMAPFWVARGFVEEGRQWTETFLNRCDEDESDDARSLALLGLSFLARDQGDGDMARTSADVLIARLKTQPNDAERALREGWARFNQGLLALDAGAIESADGRFARAAACFRTAADARGIGAALSRHAAVRHLMGDAPGTDALLAKALETLRQNGDRFWLGTALMQAAIVDKDRGDYARARRRFEECHALFLEVEAPGYAAGMQIEAASLARDSGDLAAARALGEAALADVRRIGLGRGIAAAQSLLGFTALMEQKFDEALERFEDAWPHFEKMGRTIGMAWCRHGQGIVALYQDHDLDRAEALLRAAVALYAQDPSQPESLSSAIDFLAYCALQRGDGATAARRLGLADAVREQLRAAGMTAPPAYVEIRRAVEAAIRTQIPDDAVFLPAWEFGKRNTLPSAVAALLTPSP